MKQSIEQLKEKIKSLANKSRDHRKKIRESDDSSERADLQRERCLQIRPSLRYLHLAYGFLRGRSYSEIEPNARSEPNWDTVRHYVDKYGVQESRASEDEDGSDFEELKEEQEKRLEKWIAKGRSYFQDQFE